MVYKIYFKGSNNLELNELKLTFEEMSNEEPFIIPNNIIDRLKTLSTKNKKIINIKNIDSVQKFGSETTLRDLNNFIVILITLDNKKKGFLIGYKNKIGNIMLGIWPFKESESKELYKTLIKNIGDEYQKFEKICIID